MMDDKIFMQRCFSLAQMGLGNVSPNPMVGAVVVYDGRIIGEGFHQKYGFSHAEVNAINNVKDKSLLKYSTIYVSLEPCCHYGKTPPCAELLIKHHIKKCVIANTDPNPKVAGKGIKMLQDNNIEVVSGVLEKEGLYLNRRFFYNQEKHLPFVILKYAQSKDGFIDIIRKEGEEKQNYWFTNDALKLFVHKQRFEEDAILVGYNTVINDNPTLNVRYYSGKNPVRVVYDKDLSLPKDKNIFNSESKTIVFNGVKNAVEDNVEYILLEDENDLQSMLSILYEKGIGSIIVEGGKKTITRFLEQNLWNEAYVLTGNTFLNEGIKSPVIPANKNKSTSYAGDNGIDYYFNI